MPRLFTLQEAEELLPSMERLLRSAVENKRELSELDERLNSILLRINLLGGILVEASRVAETKSDKERAVEQLRTALTEIENNGVLVKDLDMGLIDFPTLLEGQEVYLCWKLGEPHIGFWHHTSEGFTGRKAIDREFLDRHKGGRPH